MKNRKPQLASGRRVIVDVEGDGTPELGSQSGVVTTGPTGEALPKRALRSIVTFAILGFVMLLATYVVLATTVFVVMRADDHNVAVLRNTFPIGQAPADTIVYASSGDVDGTFAGRATQAVFGVPSGSVVQIVAGPVAAIGSTKDGHLTVNGKATEYEGQADPTDLSRQYVAICLSGACAEGEAVIIGQNSIVGEVRGYLALSGMTQPESAK